ncbi:MAG: hypothetical protein EHM12_11265 [Dehalococcoidia bacterium]|nr:MAG: hypothetical protein EHM12_11265 [Dehalococcoidia bacterium]
MDNETAIQVYENSGSLEQITKGEIDIQIATAKKYPRSIDKFLKDAKTLATYSPTIASECYYVLKRKDATGAQKIIEGPSIRTAEMAASAWGNMRCGARVIEEGDRFVVAQGVAFDLEKNISYSSEVRRRIVGKNGNRYSDDMVATTCNAACAIALRNAIFKAIPTAFIDDIYRTAKKVVSGDIKTISSRRDTMVKEFDKIGVDKEALLKYVNKSALVDIGLSEIEILIGVFTAIKDGETTIETEFYTQEKESGKPEIKPTVEMNTEEPEIKQKKDDYFVTSVSEKKGETNGKSYVLYLIEINGQKYSTFSDTIASIANDLMRSKHPIKFTSEKTDNGNTLQTIEPALC